MLNRVRQAAGIANHGYGAVAQAVHLIQSAGLIAGRHQENVAARLDEVGHGFIVAGGERDAPPKSRRQFVEELLIPGLAAAEHHQPEFLSLQGRRQRVEQQVDTLLLCQSRDHADQGFARVQP